MVLYSTCYIYTHLCPKSISIEVINQSDNYRVAITYAAALLSDGLISAHTHSFMLKGSQDAYQRIYNVLSMMIMIENATAIFSWISNLTFQIQFPLFAFFCFFIEDIVSSSKSPRVPLVQFLRKKNIALQDQETEIC